MLRTIGLPILVAIVLVIALKWVRGRSCPLRWTTWAVSAGVGIFYLLPRLIALGAFVLLCIGALLLFPLILSIVSRLGL